MQFVEAVKVLDGASMIEAPIITPSIVRTKSPRRKSLLRHSFISYRVAYLQNVAQVALEAGNSPRMVFSNYRELVRPVDAKKWFAITPASVAAAKVEREKQGKIIALPKAVAA